MTVAAVQYMSADGNTLAIGASSNDGNGLNQAMYEFTIGMVQHGLKKD